MTTPLIDEELEKKAKEYAEQWPLMQINSYVSFKAGCTVGARYQAEKMQAEIDELKKAIKDAIPIYIMRAPAGSAVKTGLSFDGKPSPAYVTYIKAENIFKKLELLESK